MKIRIIKNLGEEHFDKFIGTEHNHVEYMPKCQMFKVPIRTEVFDIAYCYWHKSEVEVIEEE